MDSDFRSAPDTAEPQELLDAEAQRDLERCMSMISSGSPEEKRRERRAAWRSLSTEEKLWQIGQFVVLGLSVCGIDVVGDFFHLPGVFDTILWCVVCLTLGTSKFSGS